jgi:hypothetical protein
LGVGGAGFTSKPQWGFPYAHLNICYGKHMVLHTFGLVSSSFWKNCSVYRTLPIMMIHDVYSHICDSPMRCLASLFTKAEIRKQQERRKQPKRKNWENWDNREKHERLKTRKPRKPQSHENHENTKNARSAKTAKTAKPRRLYSSQLFAAFSISFCFLIEFLCFSIFARSRFSRFLGFLGLPVSHFYASHRSGHDAQISCLDCVNLRLGYL